MSHYKKSQKSQEAAYSNTTAYLVVLAIHTTCTKIKNQHLIVQMGAVDFSPATDLDNISPTVLACRAPVTSIALLEYLELI